MLIQAHELRRKKEVRCEFQRNVYTELAAYKISDKDNFCCKYAEYHVDYRKSGFKGVNALQVMTDLS